MAIIDHTVKGVVGIADQQALMPFADAKVKAIMVIISDILMIGAKWGIATDVETRFVINVLCENGNRYEGKQNKQ